MRYPRLVCVAMALLPVCAVPLAAQIKTTKPDPEPATSFGTVTGHVYFGGSNAPARLVNIALQPLQVPDEEQFHLGKRPALSFTVYQTGLDGGYSEVRLDPPPPEDADPNFPNRNRKEVTLRQYAPGEMPLTVQGEMSGVNLPVTPQPAKAQ